LIRILITASESFADSGPPFESLPGKTVQSV
jgi:hypothetical protein